jgi:sugar lactone lactonase YvrE
VAARAPDHPGAIYAVASGFALVGQADSALAWLDRLAQIGASRAPASDSTFAALSNSPAFRAIQARLDANGLPIIHGKAAFQLPDPDLVPEALAWDPSSRSWLVGSLSKRKLIRVRPDGAATDFLSAPGVLRVVGIHVDSARALLWFATWAPRSSVAGSQDEPPSESRLFKCDLGTGRILRRYVPADSGTSHLFNDLALAANGDVFVTDTDQGWLYRIRADADSLEVFLRPDPDDWSGANGITLTGDDRTLYIAFVEGIARIDLATRQLVRLRSRGSTSTAQLDGLYWHRGALIGVQNQRGLEQIVRYDLTPDGRSILTARVLERGDNLLRRPTTGAIVGTYFHYIANSQYERLDYDNRLSPATDSTKLLTTVRVIDLQKH